MSGDAHRFAVEGILLFDAWNRNSTQIPGLSVPTNSSPTDNFLFLHTMGALTCTRLLRHRIRAPLLTNPQYVTVRMVSPWLELGLLQNPNKEDFFLSANRI